MVLVTQTDASKVTPSGIKALIRADYDAVGPNWETVMGRVFSVPAGRLADDLQPRPGMRCLDLACGSGFLARAFAARAGAEHVRASDLSESQVEGTRRALDAAGLGAIPVEVMDAERLTYAPASFDIVGCGFGINHFPRPSSAIRSVRRVLAPGGRAGFTVWAGRPSCAAAEFDRLFEKLVPDPPEVRAAELALARVVRRNSDPVRLAGMLESAGFDRVEVRTHRFPVDDGGPEGLVDRMLTRHAMTLSVTGIDRDGRRELRTRLVAGLRRFPREAFRFRREYVAILGTKPA